VPAILYVLALGAFALITTELGIIGILPPIAVALGISIQKAGWLLSGFALTVALAGPWMVGITVGMTLGGVAIARLGIATLPLASIVILLAAALIFTAERRRYGASAATTA
jgi:predicted MFS family arabinose efflux permease